MKVSAYVTLLVCPLGVMIRDSLNKKNHKLIAIKFGGTKKSYYLCTRFEKSSSWLLNYGEMVEWSITTVLKTVVLRGTGGSNPSLSAEAFFDNHQVITKEF